MKFHPPNSNERFAVVIDDVDDDLEVLYFATRELAEAHVVKQYGDYPDTTEPGGNEYLDKDRPNAVVHVCEVVSRTRL